MYQKSFKRIFDIIISLTGAVILFPAIIVVLILSSIIFKGNILFRQKRIGYQHKIFTIYKFRTMFDHRDEMGILLRDEDRVNSYGLFLRKFSLDEIPQIYNVLKGELSIIGPRPLLVDYLQYYKAEELLRHSVKPGLTGLAQINGRNCIKWNEKLNYDIVYVQNLSIILDLKIFFQTIIKVLNGNDVAFSTSLIDERKDQNSTLL